MYFTQACIVEICVHHVLVWVLFNLLGWNGQFSGAEFNPTGYVLDLIGSATVPPSTVARLSVGIMILVTICMLVIISIAGNRWDNLSSRKKEDAP